MLYEFEMSHNDLEATKNICCTKGEGSVDHSTVLVYVPLKLCSKSSREYQASSASHSPVWFIIFTTSAKIRQVAVRDIRRARHLIFVWFVIFTTSTNQANCSQRVSGELSVSQSNVVCLLHNLGKSIWSCRIVPHIIEI